MYAVQIVYLKKKEDNTKILCNVHCMFVLTFLFSAIFECSNYGVGMMSLEHWLENLSVFHTTGKCADDIVPNVLQSGRRNLSVNLQMGIYTNEICLTHDMISLHNDK